MTFEITRGRIIEGFGIVVFFVGFFFIDRLVGIGLGLPIIIYGESLSHQNNNL